jgi:hypothetical protein
MSQIYDIQTIKTLNYPTYITSRFIPSCHVTSGTHYRMLLKYSVSRSMFLRKKETSTNGKRPIQYILKCNFFADGISFRAHMQTSTLSTQMTFSSCYSYIKEH